MPLNGIIFRQETAFFVFATPSSEFLYFLAIAARTYSQKYRAKKPFPARPAQKLGSLIGTAWHRHSGHLIPVLGPFRDRTGPLFRELD